MTRRLRLVLPPDAEAAIAALDHVGGQRSFREWLVRVYEQARPGAPEGLPFGAELALEDDLPILLQATAHASGRTVEDLVADWAREDTRLPPEPAAAAVEAAAAGSMRELIDLVETLFEEVVEDAARRIGEYPAGTAALDSAHDILERLRGLVHKACT